MHSFSAERYLVTVRHDDCPAFTALLKRYMARPDALTDEETMLVYHVVDGLTDSFFPSLSELDERIDTLQAEIFASPREQQLQEVFSMKQRLVGVRRVITPQRDMFAQLVGGVVELPGINDETTRYFRDVYDHLIRLSDMIDSYRDLLTGVIDVYLSTVANRRDQIIKQLTVVAAVLPAASPTSPASSARTSATWSPTSSPRAPRSCSAPHCSSRQFSPFSPSSSAVSGSSACRCDSACAQRQRAARDVLRDLVRTVTRESSAQASALAGKPHRLFSEGTDAAHQTTRDAIGMMETEATRILIAVASKHGSTMEIAEAIGRTLGEEGLAVTVEAVDSVMHVDEYQAVVVGSAVYMGHWLEPARAFVAQHAADLKARRTWLFSSGPIGEPPLPTAEDAVHVDEFMAATGASDHRLFAGKIDRQRLGFAERALLRAVGAKEGDYRDWGAISDWARELVRDLKE